MRYPPVYSGVVNPSDIAHLAGTPRGGGYRLGMGPVVRPVAMPDDVDDSSISKASGLVELPSHVRWSPPFGRVYDLDDPADRRSLHSQVLAKGTPDDARRYIDVRKLVEMWDRVKLPSHVRPLWEPCRRVEKATGR